MERDMQFVRKVDDTGQTDPEYRLTLEDGTKTVVSIQDASAYGGKYIVHEESCVLPEDGTATIAQYDAWWSKDVRFCETLPLAKKAAIEHYRALREKS
jgi:hypothetical protein